MQFYWIHRSRSYRNATGLFDVPLNRKRPSSDPEYGTSGGAAAAVGALRSLRRIQGTPEPEDQS